jgi:hypothetical protein
MINSDRIKEILEELGYKLYDKGSYWQSSALYRNGDNQTALQIYKDTGAWKDYVKGTNFMSFKQLIILTLNTNDPDIIKKYLDPSAITFLATKSKSRDEKIETEEVYPLSLLDNLFPHYKFYNQRGIDDQILKDLKGGLATKGQMYQRFVFPIFNEYGQIHGFSGRDMSGKEGKPKWKHMGRKTNWVYPAFVPVNGEPLFEIIDTNSIIIVESIGDCLSLWQRGYRNVLVSFGLDMSSKLMCSLMRFNVSKIYLCFNNDMGKEDNRGMNACVKNFLKLLNFFDKDSIKICLPTKNDFGDMSDQDFIKWKEKMSFIDDNNQIPKIISFAKKLQKENGLSKKLISTLNNLNEEA